MSKKRNDFLIERINAALKMPGIKSKRTKATKTKPATIKYTGSEFQIDYAYGGQRLVLTKAPGLSQRDFGPRLKGAAFTDYLEAFLKGIEISQNKKKYL
jgi:hypothetical protein